jgi:hypothetical protein
MQEPPRQELCGSSLSAAPHDAVIQAPLRVRESPGITLLGNRGAKSKRSLRNWERINEKTGAARAAGICDVRLFRSQAASPSMGPCRAQLSPTKKARLSSGVFRPCPFDPVVAMHGERPVELCSDRVRNALFGEAALSRACEFVVFAEASHEASASFSHPCEAKGGALEPALTAT